METLKVKDVVLMEPGYAELWHHKGHVVLIMGNTVQTRPDGSRYIWAANWVTGERVDVLVTELEFYEGELPALLTVVRQVELWAHKGDSGAMWWLGDFYECGSRVTGANGGKALAYYIGAIRRERQWYDEGAVARVLQDGATLFRADHSEGVEDRTPSDVKAFRAKFREYRAVETGLLHYPDTDDWTECIKIAEVTN